jgi:DNA adenine methylase
VFLDNNTEYLFSQSESMQQSLFDEEIKCYPFLRWAGGKRWLKPTLHKYLPKDGFNAYHEPFIGGGSIMLHLRPKEAYISDLNSELINTYIAVKDHLDLLVNYIKEYKNTEEEYYAVRATKLDDPIKQAARFIYLNYASFNGIYRVNLNGDYNVPYGKRHNFTYNYSNLKKVSKALANVNMESGDFSNVIKNVNKGDLVFLDPPYTVTHNNNGFVEYNQKIFDIDGQERLSQLINDIKSKEAYYILTNAAHPKIKEIFNQGDSVFEVSRGSSIGGINAKRGQFSEYIFTNGV